MTIYAMQGFELLGNNGSNPSGLLEQQGWRFRVPNAAKNTSGMVISGINGGKALLLRTTQVAVYNGQASLLSYSLSNTIPSGTTISFGAKVGSSTSGKDICLVVGYGFSGFMHGLYLLASNNGASNNLLNIQYRRAVNATTLPESDGGYTSLGTTVSIGNISGWGHSIQLSFVLGHTTKNISYLVNSSVSGTFSQSLSSFGQALNPSINEIYLGQWVYNDNDSYESNQIIWVDDFYFKSGGFVDNYHNSQIRLLTLTSDTVNTNWSGQNGATTNLYTLLDENPSNDDSDYVHTNTLGSSYLAQKTNVSGAGILGNIHAVKITTIGRNVNSDNPLIHQTNMTGATTTLQSSLLVKGASTYTGIDSVISFIPGTQSGLNNIVVDNATIGFRL